ncbi:hypothetical protein BJX61DRAFT_494948 [Aspergillus egyptiacus]|nr:hypothetical protein BJX61DRAFT_494948 [Aspergillus egyptiacus]
MDIILMGKSVIRSRTRDAPVQSQRQPIESEQRPFPGVNQHAEQWGGPTNYQSAGSISPQVYSMPQHHSVHFQQAGTSSHLPPQHVTEQPQDPQQGHWVQNVPGENQQYPGTVIHNQMKQTTVSNPKSDDMGRGVRGAAVPGSQNHLRDTPHHNMPLNHQTKADRRHGKSPRQPFGSEPDLVYDSTSSGDDMMPTPDHYNDDSDTEFSENNTKSSNHPSPWRGSLYRGYSAPRHSHGNCTHYQKTPQMIYNHEHRRYQDDAVIDLVPASGRHIAGRSGKAHYTYGRQRIRPNIIHQHTTSDDLLLLNQRERAPSDIRSRMLSHWEAELEEREKLVEYQQQMLKDTIPHDRTADVGLLHGAPSRSLWEPMSTYPRGYRPRPLH